MKFDIDGTNLSVTSSLVAGENKVFISAEGETAITLLPLDAARLGRMLNAISDCLIHCSSWSGRKARARAGES
ncbi:hypothetical protein [Hoyosella altamirensis]|uniref:Uncharacterized protein n=1 Tax=Hoyosella altamirensis TaxID=616997 RepID=A0A839RST8_9ACTN|nr:hypothetical protein [Hoyosella altamirensis]MBB3039419.1 hypothetical protein [Hoyosella altamirensis]